MSVPQVLVFIDWYKPFFKAGGPVRSMVNLVDHLSGQVDFHIVTGDRDYTATEAPADLRTDEWLAMENGVRVRYCSPEHRDRRTWRSLLRERSWDVIYINGLYSTWSSIIPLILLRGSRQRRIVAVRGMLAKGPMRQGALKKRLFLAAMKLSGAFKGVEFQATNEEEVADIKHWIDPHAKVHLVPNLARRVLEEPLHTVEKVRGSVRLVSLARIAEEKNTLYAIERLKGVKGNVELDLFGAVYDEAYWERCKRAISALPKGVDVVWHGQLPEEEGATVLRAAHALYMPSVGENFGHSMLEALMVGRPLLISDRTPWRGLAASQAGWDIALEDESAFTDAVQALVDMDQGVFDGYCGNAFALGVRYLTDPVPIQRSLALFNA